MCFYTESIWPNKLPQESTGIPFASRRFHYYFLMTGPNVWLETQNIVNINLTPRRPRNLRLEFATCCHHEKIMNVMQGGQIPELCK